MERYDTDPVRNRSWLLDAIGLELKAKMDFESSLPSAMELAPYPDGMESFQRDEQRLLTVIGPCRCHYQ